jgi:putative transposase
LDVAVIGRRDDESVAGQGKTRTQPTHGGKGGVKRSMFTDGQGMPLAPANDGANRHDMKLVRKALENLPRGRPQPTASWPQHLCVEKAYDFQEVRDLVAQFGLTARIRSRGEEAKALRHYAGYRARRWVVERSHS